MFPGGAVSSLNTPPTPFADRESLEAELKALEKDIDHIQQLKVCHTAWENFIMTNKLGNSMGNKNELK